jgi:hypothetical protein
MTLTATTTKEKTAPKKADAREKLKEIEQSIKVTLEEWRIADDKNEAKYALLIGRHLDTVKTKSYYKQAGFPNLLGWVQETFPQWKDAKNGSRYAFLYRLSELVKKEGINLKCDRVSVWRWVGRFNNPKNQANLIRILRKIEKLGEDHPTEKQVREIADKEPKSVTKSGKSDKRGNKKKKESGPAKTINEAGQSSTLSAEERAKIAAETDARLQEVRDRKAAQSSGGSSSGTGSGLRPDGLIDLSDVGGGYIGDPDPDDEDEDDEAPAPASMECPPLKNLRIVGKHMGDIVIMANGTSPYGAHTWSQLERANALKYLSDIETLCQKIRGLIPAIAPAK